MLEQIRKRLHEYIDAATDPRDLWRICHDFRFGTFGGHSAKLMNELEAMVRQLGDEDIEYMLSPNACPVCGSFDIEASRLDVTDNEATGEVACHTCGAEWMDFYQMTGMELVDEGNWDGD